jgi:hypothetical protein
VARVIKKSTPNKENINTGCPSKLTLHDKWAIIHCILTGEASNAIQATGVVHASMWLSAEKDALYYYT